MNSFILWISTWLTSPHTLTLDGWVWLVGTPLAFIAFGTLAFCVGIVLMFWNSRIL